MRLLLSIVVLLQCARLAALDLDDPVFLGLLQPAVGGGGGGSVSFAYASTATRSTGSQNKITNSITIGATLSGGYVVVGFAFWDAGAASISSVTFNGSACTLLQGRTDGSSVRAALYGVAVGNLASGTYDAVVTFSANASEWCIGTTALNGANQSSQSGTGVNAGGTSTTPSVTVSSASGEMVVDCMMNYGNVSMTVGSGQTQRWTGGQSSTTTAASSTESGAASVVMDWTLGGSTDWTIVAFPVKP